MSRRSLTLVLSGLLAIGLVLIAAVVRVPYVALAPGPTYNTLSAYTSSCSPSDKGTPVIAVSGHPTYDDNGNLNMTTVNLTGTKARGLCSLMR